MKKELISKFLVSLVAILFFILMALNSFLVLTKTAIFPSDYQETLYYSHDNTILNIVLVILFSIALFFLSKYIKKIIGIKRFVLLAMIYLFIVSLLFAILRRDYVQYDPFNVIDQASNFLRGNYTGLEKGNNYLYIYSHQITTVFMFQILFAIFGRVTFILYLLQCFSISYILFMLYKISNILFNNEDTAYITVILTLFSFPLVFYVAFIYGTLPGMFLTLLAFYHFIKYYKTKNWYDLVIVLLSINVAILLIGNNLINMLAIFSVAVILLIKKFDKKILLFMICTLIFMTGAKSTIENYYSVASQKDIPKGVNKISWIAMGMQEGDREAGWWNKFNYDIMTEEDYDNDKVVEISKKSIMQRVDVFQKNPKYALDFYVRKYENQFIEPTFQSLVITVPQKDVEEGNILIAIKNKILKELYFGTTNKILFFIMKIMQIFIYVFTMAFALITFKKKKENYLIIPISFIGGTIFHMVWEAKSRYIFPYFIFLIPLAAYGFNITKDIVVKYYNKKRGKNYVEKIS
ncbi:glycosyltransferase family 39 protein [Gemella sp. GH3]|uniref:glycosyltransferase family 39 protein n=1 Tax=unclassified Gemella TaxID=2624949 RepID=UPI0015CF8653|nr:MULTISPECIES: glycosyltransferase family 39 protein [unclassified Gemella]MBF0713192.1 glycosyltransferase family 39 protein [Gemella sp. GH3.1]NYS50144.1 glycosyltransferase family 39 protein [Gemella sp. GH3]